jgi:hypothetical protein
MAKKRKASKVRYITRKAKSYARRKSSPGRLNVLQPDAMLYGALRQPISAATTQLMGNVPLVGGIAGRYLDNAAMGTVAYLAAKKGKGMIKNWGLKGLTIENALVGADLGQQFIPSIGMSSNSGTNGYPV